MNERNERNEYDANRWLANELHKRAPDLYEWRRAQEQNADRNFDDTWFV